MLNDHMSWQQKLSALQVITDTCLRMRKPDDWYVSAHGREVTDGRGVLVGEYGNGESPAEAVMDDWNKLVTNLAPGKFIVVHYGCDSERRYRWNGFMWSDVAKDSAA